MSNNQTIDGVLVSRELLKRALANILPFESATAVRNELRALLDAKPETVAGHHPACRAVDDYKPGECTHSCKPAAQPLGTPVAWRYREGEGTQWRLTDMPPSTWYFDPRQYEVRNLYDRHAPAPIGVVLPERAPNEEFGEAYDSGWNACLDEVTRLNAKE